MSAFDDPEIARNILESLPLGLCVIDKDKRIVYWSKGAEHITGHQRYEVVGRSCVGESLLHCDQPGCEFCNEDCPMARAMKTAQAAEAIGFLHHKAGYEIPVRVRAVPVHNLHGSIIGALETFSEIEPGSIEERNEDAAIPGCVDEVTGLASHTMMQAHLREALGTFLEVQVSFGVLCIRIERIDHFRAAFGIEAATALLRVFARTLERALSRNDVLGRWSDDQFLVILGACREESLRSVRERLRRTLANDAIQWWGERRSLPVSIGYAAVAVGDSLETLMNRLKESMQAGGISAPLRGDC